MPFGLFVLYFLIGIKIAVCNYCVRAEEGSRVGDCSHRQLEYPGGVSYFSWQGVPSPFNSACERTMKTSPATTTKATEATIASAASEAPAAAVPVKLGDPSADRGYFGRCRTCGMEGYFSPLEGCWTCGF